MTSQARPEPVEGDQRDFIFVDTDGRSVVVTATYESTWNGDLEPCVSVDEVYAILDAWTDVDPEHRQYLFPTTERSDDDVFIAYVRNGRAVLDSWPVASDRDHYSLATLPEKLPSDQYTLIEPEQT